MLPLMPTIATTATPDHTTDMAMAVDTMVDTNISARGPLMPNPKLMPNPRPMPPLMPTMATTATPDTTVDMVLDTMVDTLAVITVMVDTTDTPTVMATDISARGPLMPNPRPMPMPPLMLTMATTDMADTMVDTTD